MRNRIACSAQELSQLDPDMVESVVGGQVYKIGNQYFSDQRVNIVEGEWDASGGGGQWHLRRVCSDDQATWGDVVHQMFLPVYGTTFLSALRGGSLATVS